MVKERELIERARQRDPGAWSEIYQRFSGPLYGFFLYQVRNQQTAEDLTAGVFLEALQAAARFHGDIDGMRSWLFRIGRHNLIDHVRRSRRATFETIEEASEQELARSVPAEDPEESALSRLSRQRVMTAIDGLSLDQREVILLRLSGGLSSPEIAQIVGKTTGAVKALQHRAMAALTRVLGDKEG